MMEHTYNPSTQEDEAGGCWVRGQPKLQGKALSQNDHNKQTKPAGAVQVESKLREYRVFTNTVKYTLPESLGYSQKYFKFVLFFWKFHKIFKYTKRQPEDKTQI